MRLLIQRVKQAQVTVGEKVCGKIGPGLLLFLGIHKQDSPQEIEWLVNKVVGLRVFKDETGKMNRTIEEVGGQILVVSQFTLYGSCTQGKRPEFTEAALPEPAFLLYEEFINELTARLDTPIQSGIFGATMEVALINDGPVTFFLER